MLPSFCLIGTDKESSSKNTMASVGKGLSVDSRILMFFIPKWLSPLSLVISQFRSQVLYWHLRFLIKKSKRKLEGYIFKVKEKYIRAACKACL